VSVPVVKPASISQLTTKGITMISTVDLTRKGLLRIIGYLEVTHLPAPERFQAAIDDLVSWVEDHPEDLDRFFASTPTVPPVAYPKWEHDVTPGDLAPIAPITLTDYDHAGFKATTEASTASTAKGYRDWHNDPHHTDLP
jgi:hypothetical protein